MNKIFIIPLLILFIVPGVLGLTTDVYFDADPTVTSKTIYKGESAEVTTFAFTTSPPVTGTVTLRSNDNTFSTTLDTFSEDGMFGSYSDVLTITNTDYAGYGDGCGEFNVYIQASDNAGGNEYDTASLSITCDNPPVWTLPANVQLYEDSGFNNNLLNLNDYVSDDQDTDAQLTITLDDQSNTAIVDCSIDADRNVDCTVVPEQSGTSTLTFSATDTFGNVATETLEIIVNPVNNPVVLSDIPDVSFDEDESDSSIDLDDYVSDVETADEDITWTYSGNTNIIVSIDANNVVTFSAPADWYGVETVTFTADDNDGSTASDDVVVTVNSVNDPVVLSDIPDVSFDEDGSDSSIDLDDYVSDVETADEDITWTYSGNANIIVSIDANNVVTFSAPADWYGVETVTFTADDNDGSTASDDVVVTVTSVNDAPVVTPLSVTFDEDNSFTVQLDDYVTDVETADEDITWTFSSGTNVIATYDAVTREVTFSAPADWYGNELLTMTATDEGGVSTGATANITVVPVNDAPTLDPIGDLSATETVPFTYTVTASDVDGDALTFSDNTALFDIDPASGVISFTPTLADVGTHSITITVSDGALTSSETITFEVVEFNLPPTITITQPADGATLVTGTNYDFLAVADDPNTADTLTYDWDFGDGTSATTLSADKTYAAGGTYTVTVTVNDSLLSDADSIDVNVLELGFDVTVDVFADDNFSVAQTTFNRDEPVYVAVAVDEITTGTPVPGLTQDIRLFNSATGLGTVTLQPYTGTASGVTIIDGEPATPDGTYYYYLDNLPVADEQLGSNDITVTASNATHAGSTMKVITVLNNEVVTLGLPNVTFDEDTTTSLALDAYVNDVETPDADLVWNVTGNINVIIDIDPVSHVANFTAPINWHGVETVVFTVDDTDGSVRNMMIDVTVVSVNDAPVVNVTNVTFAEDTNLSINLDDYVSDDDLPASSLVWSATSSAHVTVSINPTSRVATFVSDPDWSGQEYVTLTVDDGNASTTVNVLVNVTPVNDEPVLSVIPNQNATEMHLFSLQAVATDVDGDSLTFSDNTALFDIDPATGFISFVPDFTHVGTHTITITVSDGTMTDSESFILEIAPAFVPPIATIDYPVDGSLVLVNETVTFSAASSYDPDGGPIVEYTWDFGDGHVVTTTDPTIDLLFKELMTRTATLTVLDDDDRTATTTVTFSVVPYIGDCMDGIDNDGDGLVDMDDPGCSSPHDYSEFNYDMSSIEEGVKMASVSVSGALGEGYAVPGDVLVVRVLAENDADARLDTLRVGVIIPELGIKRKSSSFDMSSGKRLSKDMTIFLPEDVMPGEYDVHITVTNDDIRRSVHRWIEIVE